VQQQGKESIELRYKKLKKLNGGNLRLIKEI